MRLPIDYIRPAGKATGTDQAVGGAINAGVNIVRQIRQHQRSADEIERQGQDLRTAEDRRLLGITEQGSERYGSDVFGVIEGRQQLDESRTDLSRTGSQADVALEDAENRRRVDAAKSKAANKKIIIAAVAAAVVLAAAIAYKKSR